jgi:hypothetical protein
MKMMKMMKKMKKKFVYILTLCFLVFDSLLLLPQVQGKVNDVLPNGELTLEVVLERALEDEHNLIILEYKHELLEKKVLESELRIKDIDRTNIEYVWIPKLECGDPSDPDYMHCYVQNEMNSFLGYTMFDSYRSAVEGQKAERKRLVDIIERYNMQVNRSDLNRLETKAAIRLNMIRTYTSLLAEERQIKLDRALLAQKKQDLYVKERQFELGTIAESELNKVKREVAALEKSVEDLLATHRSNLYTLLFDLDLEEQRQVKLKKFEVDEIKPLSRTKEMQDLIESSYQWQMAQKELEEMKYERRVKSRETQDLNRSVRESVLQQSHIEIKIKEEEIRKLENSLKLKIEEIYRSVNDAYHHYVIVEDEFKQAEIDTKTAEMQFELGLISHKQYEQSKLGLEQTKAKLENAKYSYFHAQQAVLALEQGYIPVYPTN